jgi:hypothetical protein
MQPETGAAISKKPKPAAASFPRMAPCQGRGARADASRYWGLVFKPLCGGMEERFMEERFALIVVDGSRQDVVGFYDATDIVAQWQAYAKAAGLPLLLPHGARSDAYERLYDHVGAVRLGTFIASRRHALLSGRRPRFLVRRKTARLPERPVVWR